MKDTTYAVDIEWQTGNTMRSDDGLSFKDAQHYARQARTNAAIARVQLVRVVTTETIVNDWKRK